VAWGTRAVCAHSFRQSSLKPYVPSALRKDRMAPVTHSGYFADGRASALAIWGPMQGVGQCGVAGVRWPGMFSPTNSVFLTPRLLVGPGVGVELAPSASGQGSGSPPVPEALGASSLDSPPRVRTSRCVNSATRPSSAFRGLSIRRSAGLRPVACAAMTWLLSGAVPGGGRTCALG